MAQRPLTLTATTLLALLGCLAFAEVAEARGDRRNYADEWRREERRERDREERERARQERIEHQEQMQRQWQEHSQQQQQQYLEHRERHLDSVLDHMEGKERSQRAAPAPAPPPAKRGTCIYGEGDKILYQPAGVICSK